MEYKKSDVSNISTGPGENEKSTVGTTCSRKMLMSHFFQILVLDFLFLRRT